MESVELKFNNTWAARRGEAHFGPLEEEVKEGRAAAIYCFQEVFMAPEEGRKGNAWDEPTTNDQRHRKQLWPPPQADQFNRYQQLLKGTHRGFFSENKKGYPYKDIPEPPGVAPDLSFGHAMFVHNNFYVEKSGKEGIIRQIEDDGSDEYIDKRGTLQWLQVDINDKQVIVAQFHGLRSSEGKGDTPERMRQSESVRKFLDEKIQEGLEVILCGDFNLYPDTESMRILEEGLTEGMEDNEQKNKFRLRNLITEHGIKTTRNRHSKNTNELSDYILVSSGIEVEDFRVEEDSETSDHLPLYLKFR